MAESTKRGDTPSGQAMRLAVITAGLVVAAVLATVAAASSIVAGVLAAALAGGVAGLAVYGAIQSAFVKPLSRLFGAAGLSSADSIAALEVALADLQRRAERLKALEAQTSALRHDLRGMLSPALLTADRLTGHEDPKVSRTGEVVIRAINRATERLAATKELP